MKSVELNQLYPVTFVLNGSKWIQMLAMGLRLAKSDPT